MNGNPRYGNGAVRVGLVLLVIALVALAWGLLSPSAALAGAYEVVYVDGHMHTVESDGTGSLQDMQEAGLAQGLQAIIVTNHAEELTLAEWQALTQESRELSSDGFLVINGLETTGDEGIFNRDHVLAWNVSDPFVGPDWLQLSPSELWPSPLNPYGTGALYPENIAKWVGFIHFQGGLAVHAHPTGSTNSDYGVDFIEVFNHKYVDDLTSALIYAGFPFDGALKLALALNNMAIYGERDLSILVPYPSPPFLLTLKEAILKATSELLPPYIGQHLGAPQAPLHSWDEQLLAYVSGEVDHPTFAVANSDAHSAAGVGMAKNGVFIRGALTERALLSALEAGHCFATTGPSIDFSVNGKMMGQTARPRAGVVELQLSVSAETATAVVVNVTVLKNGELWKTYAPGTPSYQATIADEEVEEDGYYRVEVTTCDESSRYGFAYSNPVFVR